MEGSPDLFWAMASLAGGFGFLGIGMAFRSWRPSWPLPTGAKSVKTADREGIALQQPQPPPPTAEQCRLEGRNQILESSHWVLQQELVELRLKMSAQGAEVARETALRMHLEVALGKAHEACDELRSQVESARQKNAELTLLKAILETENSDLKGRLEKISELRSVDSPPATAPITQDPSPVSTVPETVRPGPGPIRLPAVLKTPPTDLVTAAEGFPAAEPTVLPVRNRAWTLELQNFRRRTTEKPIKRGKQKGGSKTLPKP